MGKSELKAQRFLPTSLIGGYNRIDLVPKLQSQQRPSTSLSTFQMPDTDTVFRNRALQVDSS
jgi:hypothetical protein